jgi:hypothetical protein
MHDISLGYHSYKLSRRIAPLKAVVHVMEAIKSPMTKFSTNLTRAVWSTVEIVGRKRLLLGRGGVTGQQDFCSLVIWAGNKLLLRTGGNSDLGVEQIFAMRKNSALSYLDQGVWAS